jgi:sulfatase modifying factor 1
MKRTLSVLGFVMPLAVFAADPPGETTNSVGMKLVRIAPGEFTMGAGTEPPKSIDLWSKRDYDESPAHKVRITRAFSLGVTEVTNAQYEQFDPEHKRFRGRDGVSKADDEPVTFVAWPQAVAYCEWLSKKEGKPYRLPTEAEWEYACRAGTETPFNTGDTLTAEQANIGQVVKDGKPTTVRVASYKPNAWGLFDMHGNVLEWCLDWHGPYDKGEQADPVGREDGYAKVARGWCFHRPERAREPMKYWRSANRSGFLPEDANRYTGFRVAQGEMPATKPLPVVPAAYQKDVKQTPAPTDGPDPAKPYFVNWTANGKNPTIPADSFGPVFSQHNHFGAVCVCPNGDVLMAWYTCVNEPGRELAQACSRLRVGADSWEPASPFFDVPDVNDHAPVLLTAGKRVFHFCTQSLRGWDNATNIVRYSDDNGVTWSEPTIMLSRDDPKALSQPCSAFVAKDGRIVVACDGDQHKDERLLTSADGGKTWRVAAGDMRATAGRYAIHPAVAPLEDGRVINFLRDPDPMPAQFSGDLGETWTQKASPFPGIRGGQKAAALKLKSKALLLISMDNKGTVADKGGTFAALSLDDGQTWAHVRKLDGVRGYMSAAQAPNGVIHVVGTKTTAVSFNEAWLKEGAAFPRK